MKTLKYYIAELTRYEIDKDYNYRYNFGTKGRLPLPLLAENPNKKLSRIAWSIYRSVRQNYDL